MNFEFSARLDMDEIGGRQDVEMSLGTDRSIRLTIADNALKDPAVTAKKRRL